MKYYGTLDNINYGFYEEKFKGFIEITDEYWKQLLDAQNKGKIIIPFENSVIAVDESKYDIRNGAWVKLSKDEIKNKEKNDKKQLRSIEIEAELDDLDKKRIRALAEPSMKDENETWLEFYNNKIRMLRNELSNL